jgi:hypothetical protein
VCHLTRPENLFLKNDNCHSKLKSSYIISNRCDITSTKVVRGTLMILDTMTYSVMTVAAALSFVVILLASIPQNNKSNSNK